MKNIKKEVEKIKNMMEKEENKKRIDAIKAGIVLGLTGFLGYKIGCSRAISKISNEFYIILEDNNDLKKAFKEAVEDKI